MQGASEAGRARRTRLTAGQRRETILEAATEVFAASGYRAGKVSDVAARIGVTEPVIFQNFGSKAALFAAVLDRTARDLSASLDSLAGHHDSGASLLAHILSPGDAAQPHEPGAHRMLFADAAALVADPEAGEAASGVARAVAAHLADLVRRGQGDGSVRGDVNAEGAAWLVLSVLATRPLRAGAMADADRLEPEVGGLALRAILAPGRLPVRYATQRRWLPHSRKPPPAATRGYLDLGHQLGGLYHTDSHGMAGVTATAGTAVVSPGPTMPFAETLVGLREK